MEIKTKINVAIVRQVIEDEAGRPLFAKVEIPYEGKISKAKLIEAGVNTTGLGRVLSWEVLEKTKMTARCKVIELLEEEQDETSTGVEANE